MSTLFQTPALANQSYPQFKVTLGVTLDGAPVLNGDTPNTFSHDFDFKNLDVYLMKGETQYQFVLENSSTGKPQEAAYLDFGLVQDTKEELLIKINNLPTPDGYELAKDSPKSFLINGSDTHINIKLVSISEDAEVKGPQIDENSESNNKGQTSTPVLPNITNNQSNVVNVYTSGESKKSNETDTHALNKENKPQENKVDGNKDLKPENDKQVALDKNETSQTKGGTKAELSDRSLPKTSDTSSLAPFILLIAASLFTVAIMRRKDLVF
ncbi:MAG: hypothetical protein Q4E22_01560 [Coriobacteriia bacterium]|nr:hypothetical protein [Coriobacteriia bacterium]